MTRLVMPFLIVIFGSVMFAYFNIARFIPFLSNLWVSVVFGISALIVIYLILHKWLREH